MTGMTNRLPAEIAPSSEEQVTIPQYSRRAILAVWAAAALPMAVLAWLVAPPAARWFEGDGNVPMAKALFLLLTLGLLWQFVLVVGLIWREQRSLRWSTLREALWLRAPRSPRTGRTGGRVWLVLIPLLAVYTAVHVVLPPLPMPTDRDVGALMESDAGLNFLSGNWPWFGLFLVMVLLNTVLGEELLFRGFLLPRMNGAFGRGDWVANGVLFAVYHLHAPWAIPDALLSDTLLISYPAKRYRSAWIGIVVHSSQSVFFGLIVLMLVLK